MGKHRPGTIVSLTYHEITQDPRVLKEARALHSAGYDVHVFCDWPEGFPEHDEIDGVQVTRFRCFGYEHATPAALEDMAFLDRSRDALAERYLPFAHASGRLAEIAPALKEKFGDDVFERMRSRQYKYARGVDRYRRFAKHLILHIKMQAMSPLREASGSRAQPFRCIQEWRRQRRKLFQAQAVVYWANFPSPPNSRSILAIHAHDIFCLPAGVMLSQQCGAPLVYDAHEYEPARATKMDGTAARLPEWLEDDCFPYVSRLITVSQGIAALYARRFQGPTPIVVMNAPEVQLNTAEGPKFSENGRAYLHERANLPRDVPVVVFTGLVQRAHRGLDKVLKALALVPELHLVILGPRLRGDDRWLMKVARGLGVAKRVHLLPPVDAREVPSAIRSATVSVCPFQDVSLNHRFAMPNKLFEAAFAEIPICVSDFPEMRSFVETLGIGETMDSSDPHDIARVLRRVIQKKDEYRITPSTRAKLDRFYSWHSQTEKLLSLYEDLIGAP